MQAKRLQAISQTNTREQANYAVKQQEVEQAIEQVGCCSLCILAEPEDSGFVSKGVQDVLAWLSCQVSLVLARSCLGTLSCWCSFDWLYL